MNKLVFCRIGSLETPLGLLEERMSVFCRIGSLEMIEAEYLASDRVFCRIGSLEMPTARAGPWRFCFLPHRQLRKMDF